MTKEITKTIILQELEDKLKLREWESERFLFSEMVVPTYAIKEHLQYPTADYKQVSIVSGPDAYLFFTVPQNERWFLSTYNIVFMAAGAYTVTGLYINRKKQKTPGSFIYLDMTLGQSVSYMVDLPKPVRLDPGDAIWVYVDSYTISAALRLYIAYTSEEIR
jgi:hypothetical protein